MKILRLFITNDLSTPINWVLINDNEIETGQSSFDDLAGFDDVSLEVYLSTNCCSIFKTNVTGIASKRLTEELMLGLIETSLTDEIDEVKAITLHIEDGFAFVAVFNKIYYQTLMQWLNYLEKPISFIQSFAFATIFEEKSWTLFLGIDQSFLRTSKFEYYCLDDNRPIPSMLEDMLQLEKPKSLLVYASDDYDIKNIANKFNIPCKRTNNQLEYGVFVWNFYIQKSTNFNIKLDKKSTKIIFRLLNRIKYLVIFMVLFWGLHVTMLLVNSMRIKSQINNNLKGVVAVTQLNKTIIEKTANEKINSLRHLRGIYDGKDAVVLLTKFLQIVSTITTNDIKQFSYNNGEANIFVGSSFDTSLFNSYKNVLATRTINATIEDYKTYSKNNKNKPEKTDNNINATTSEIIDAAWVITLKPTMLHEVIGNK